MTARFEHVLTKTQMLSAELQRNHTSSATSASATSISWSGVPPARTEDVLRVSTTGSIGKTMYNEFRVQWRADDIAYAPVSHAPAVLVPNAFNTGGAQLAGARATNEVEIANDLDISIGRHAMRAGFLIEGGRYDSDVRRNATGTFTFAITWSPFKDGKTTIRAGGGIFFDWFDAPSYEQAVQLDGTHQQISTIVAPGYPDPTRGGLRWRCPPGACSSRPT